MRSRILLGIAVGIVSLLSMASSPEAHHGVTGQYDAARPIVLNGILSEAVFAPPHPVLTVRVDDLPLPSTTLGRPEEYFGPVTARPEDVGAELVVELSPVRMFYNLAARIEPGDRITLIALRNCLPPHQLRSTWILLADGDVVSYDGDWAPGVDGCQ
jgi:hypothetical protein